MLFIILDILDNIDTVNRTIDHSLHTDSSVRTCDVCFNLNQHCLCVKCINCLCSLEVPFIECSECENVSLCCRCFSQGIEKHTHKSYHKYRVMKHDIVLFEKSNWTAEEELIMLDILMTYGYGNWEMISKKLRNRTEQEVKEHYDKFYLDEACSALPRIPDTQESLFPTQVVPYRYRLTNIEEPPRYAPSTSGYQSVAGYNAARSDFEIEYDANCEDILAKLSETDIPITHPQYHVLQELQCGLIRSYNRRVKERERRKRVIRSHGLILLRKTISSLHRYENTITRSVAERMLIFMQFLNGMEFDFLMEGLHRAAELKQRISK